MTEQSPSKKRIILEWIKKHGHRIDEHSGTIVKIKGGIKKPTVDKQGYLKINCGIGGKKYAVFIHQLVWIKVNGSVPKGFSIDHINRVKTDNRITNLRIADLVEQQQNCHRTKLSRQDVLEIVNSKSSLGELAEKFNTTKGYVYTVKRRNKVT